MNPKPIIWQETSYGGQAGTVGPLRLFSISYGVKRSDTMYVLRCELPVKSSLLGQNYATPEDAKAGADRLLRAIWEAMTDSAPVAARDRLKAEQQQ